MYDCVMADEQKTNDELLAMRENVQRQIAENQKRMERMTLGSSARTRKAMFGGSLTFALLTIESDLRERGLCD